jgi:uncharacterized protein (TIGR00269 family)
VLELRRHNTAFCGPDYVDFFRHHVLETVRRWRMFARDEPVMVAVSGGKDSLALWDVLHDAGYRTTGLYIDLGIFDYSRASRAKCDAFAAERGLELRVVAVADATGAPIPSVRAATRRPTCSACGLSKRYIMNRAALEASLPVVATGHNLDDEAATLLGSTLRWDESALGRQAPVLDATHPKLVRRVKPLFRMTERETAAYAFLRGIDYIVEECPFARGATSIAHKEVLNRIEDASPGSKAMFVQGFLDRARGLFQARDTAILVECVRCGQATTAGVCAFCKLREQVERATIPAAAAALEDEPAAARGLISDLHAASEIHAP